MDPHSDGEVRRLDPPLGYENVGHSNCSLLPSLSHTRYTRACWSDFFGPHYSIARHSRVFTLPRTTDAIPAALLSEPAENPSPHLIRSRSGAIIRQRGGPK